MNLEIRDINIIVFPDWQQPEEFTYEQLTKIIKFISTHTSTKSIALFIDDSNDFSENSHLILSDILLNLSIQEIPIFEESSVIVLGTLNELEQDIVKQNLSARLSIEKENGEAIEESGLEKLPICQLNDAGDKLVLVNPSDNPEIQHMHRYMLISNIGSDSSNEWIKKSATIFGWLFPGEHEFLWDLASRKCEGHVLEIGTWMGKSACILAGACIENAPDTKVICVDPFDMQGAEEQEENQKKLVSSHQNSTFDTFIENAKRLSFIDYIIPISTTSEKSLGYIDCKLRMAFIDGQHDYEHVKQDTELVLPKLVTGGVLVLHDASGQYPGINQYIDTYLKNNSALSFIGSVGSMVAFQKV